MGMEALRRNRLVPIANLACGLVTAVAVVDGNHLVIARGNLLSLVAVSRHGGDLAVRDTKAALSTVVSLDVRLNTIAVATQRHSVQWWRWDAVAGALEPIDGDRLARLASACMIVNAAPSGGSTEATAPSMVGIDKFGSFFAVAGGEVAEPSAADPSAPSAMPRGSIEAHAFFSLHEAAPCLLAGSLVYDEDRPAHVLVPTLLGSVVAFVRFGSDGTGDGDGDGDGAGASFALLQAVEAAMSRAVPPPLGNHHSIHRSQVDAVRGVVDGDFVRPCASLSD